MFSRSLPKTYLLMPVLLAMITGGCATREFVQAEVGQVGKRIEGLEGMLVIATQRLDIHSSRLGNSENRLTQAEQNAAALAKRNDETQAGLAGANQRMDAIAGDLSTAQKQIEAGSVEIARAHQRLDQVDARVDQTSQRLQGTVAGLALAEGRIVALETSKRTAGAASVSAAPQAAPEPAPMPVAAAAKPVVAEAAAISAPSTGAPITDANSRLDRIAALLAATDQKIEANAGALANASARVSGLEKGLEITDKRTRDSEDGLKLTQQKLTEVEGQLGSAKALIQDNSASLAQAGKRIDGLETNLINAGNRLDSGEKGLAESNQRIAQAEGNLKQQSERLTQNETSDGKISALAQEALERAQSAHKLAEGKLVFETALTEDVGTFGFEKAKLSDTAKQALADFANRLKAENKNVYIEIQGHTDSSGPEAANMILSRQRAEQVRDYLYQEAGIPLHRLAVVAYGETRPIADNKTKAGRIQNRRVVLVVLK